MLIAAPIREHRAGRREVLYVDAAEGVIGLRRVREIHVIGKARSKEVRMADLTDLHRRQFVEAMH